MSIFHLAITTAGRSNSVWTQMAPDTKSAVAAYMETRPGDLAEYNISTYPASGVDGVYYGHANAREAGFSNHLANERQSKGTYTATKYPCECVDIQEAVG